MAIAKGKASKEAQEFKRFIGVCPVTIKAVNPNKTELSQLFNNNVENEPEYVQDKEDFNGQSYKNVRINLVLEPVQKAIGFEMPLITFNVFLTNQYKQGSASGKYQIIDKYGRTAWATKEEINAGQIPMYASGPANIDKDYRVAYVGEEELTYFTKTFLSIPDIMIWDNNLQKMVPNTQDSASDCECRYDKADLEKLFKGDFSVIKETLGLQPNNVIKVCLGIRRDENTGRLYQVVYTKVFMHNNQSSTKRLAKSIQEDAAYTLNAGRSINVEYSTDKVHEYVVEPTTFTTTSDTTTNNAVDDLPFGPADDNTVAPW